MPRARVVRGRVGVLMLVGLIPLAGCQNSSGPVFGRQAMVGTLKASVSQLEYENQQLKTQVAELNRDKREAEDRLSQEEQANGDLAARLDDARELLRRQGVNMPESKAARVSDESIPPPRAPARKQNRKPPSVELPRVDPPDEVDSEQEPPSTKPRRRTRSSTDQAAYRQQDPDDTRWFPVARSSTLTASPVIVR